MSGKATPKGGRAAGTSAGGKKDEVGQWVKTTDKRTGKQYYVNRTTRKTSWKRPASYREPDWVESRDPKSGRSFYYNKKTKERSWKKPAGGFRPLPAASATNPAEWRELTDEKSGRKYYYNRKTKEKSWVAPKGFDAAASAAAAAASGKGRAGGATKGAPSPKAASGGAKKQQRSPWRAVTDKKTNRTYYFNRVTKKTQWKRPADMGPEEDGKEERKQQAARRRRPAGASSAAAGRRGRGAGAGGGEDEEEDEEDEDDDGEEEDEDEDDDDDEKEAEVRAAPRQPARRRPMDTLDDYDSYSEGDDDEEGAEGGGAAAGGGGDAAGPRGRMKTVVLQEDENGDAVPQFDMEVDVFTEAFKLLPKTEDEDLLLRRLELLDVEDPGNDPRVAAVVNRRRGLFAALVRILKRFPQNEAVVERAMHALKKLGSVEEFVIPAVESDIVGRVIATLTLHMNSKTIVGDSVILLGNLSLNDYVKELIRMEEGVKVISLVMVNELHQNDAAILDKCCYCLANLAVDNVENVKEIIAGGALASTIACMERFRNNTDLLDSGTVVLSNLCAGGEEHRRAIAEAGAVRALVSIIEHQCVAAGGQRSPSGSDAGLPAAAQDDASGSLQVMHDCLRALGNLGLHADTIPLLLRDGAVAALVRTIDAMDAHPSVATLAVSVLGNLAAFCDSDQVAAMARDGGVEACVRASRAHPDNVEVQKAFFGSLANFAKATVHAGSQIDEAVMSAAAHVREVMQHLDSQEAVLSRGLRLVVRVAQQEHRTWRLVKEGFPGYLARLLRKRASHGSVKVVRDILLCTAAISNESTARDVAAGTLVETITGVVVELEEDQKAVEAAVKALRNLAVHPEAALKVAESGMRPLAAAARRYRNKPSFVEKVAPLFGDLAVFAGTMEFVSAAHGGELLVELLEEYSRSPSIAAKIIVALHNMTVSDEEFGKRLKAARIERTVNPIVDEHGGHVQLRSAAVVFLARLRELPELGEERRRFDELGDDEKNRLLRDKFNIPELPRSTTNFLLAGQQLRVHRRSGNPKQRHVFVSDQVRFLCLRDPGSEKPEVKFPLRCVTEVLRGAGSAKALKRSYFMQKSAVPEHSLVVTVEEEEPFCFECESAAQRDQWANMLRDAYQYRQSLQKMRSELTEEEKAAYY